MAPTQNTTLQYLKIPQGYPVPGETMKKVTSEIDLDTVPLHGGILLKQKALSLSSTRRFILHSPFTPNAPLSGYAVGQVLRSENENFKVGDAVYGRTEFSTYAVVPKQMLGYCKVIENKEGLPWTQLVGGAGMSGQTAYWSFYNIGKPKKGETIYITAAAGAVGQIVLQLAKREGLKVVASCGDAAKLEFCKSLGADVVVNYKDGAEAVEKVMREHPCDIFYDNVGGEQLDLALATCNTFGRIIACGGISAYSSGIHPLKNYMQMVVKQLRWEGFIISGKDMTEFFKEMPKLIADGTIKVREHVVKGIDDGEAFLDLLTGKAQGKVVISLE
ncbi:BQ2448_903 [Microbotryum intermedium]|uniref:BQ2448_903 protein n=1 Tax=Microbotryum intermedium TaxID=269621 RepID=A0A238F3Y0_9BASI|nr:BQ2448_903 [Microbotryum intermedium]